MLNSSGLRVILFKVAMGKALEFTVLGVNIINIIIELVSLHLV